VEFRGRIVVVRLPAEIALAQREVREPQVQEGILAVLPRGQQQLRLPAPQQGGVADRLEAVPKGVDGTTLFGRLGVQG
jgi:hypothetical protein